MEKTLTPRSCAHVSASPWDLNLANGSVTPLSKQSKTGKIYRTSSCCDSSRNIEKTLEGTHWLQCPGERTADYINKWRNAAWSDPKVTKVPERDLVRSCLSAAAYEGRHGPLTFASAYDKAKLRRMRVTPARTLEQFYVESHIQRVLKALEKGGSRLLAKHHPEVRQTRRLGWPVFKLFREGEVAPLSHLLRYHALVRLKKQGTDYALRHFPFSLASRSTALLWFAKLQEKSLAGRLSFQKAFDC